MNMVDSRITCPELDGLLLAMSIVSVLKTLNFLLNTRCASRNVMSGNYVYTAIKFKIFCSANVFWPKKSPTLKPQIIILILPSIVCYFKCCAILVSKIICSTTTASNLSKDSDAVITDTAKGAFSNFLGNSIKQTKSFKKFWRKTNLLVIIRSHYLSHSQKKTVTSKSKHAV